MKKKNGRPTIFTQKLADEICAQLSEGRSMRTVCRADDMPAISTVFNWLRTNEKFLAQYARAKEEAADALVEEMLEIADNSPSVVVGNDRSDSARVNAHRMRVDTRKWIASKLKPKRYGDKLDVTTDGKPIQAPALISVIPPRENKDNPQEGDSK